VTGEAHADPVTKQGYFQGIEELLSNRSRSSFFWLESSGGQLVIPGCPRPSLLQAGARP
jgi:hypothetical protein